MARKHPTSVLSIDERVDGEAGREGEEEEERGGVGRRERREKGEIQGVLVNHYVVIPKGGTL